MVGNAKSYVDLPTNQENKEGGQLTLYKDFEIPVDFGGSAKETLLVDFFFVKGYPRTYEEPECPDEIELAKVVLCGQSILKYLSKETVEFIETYIIDSQSDKLYI